MPMYKAPKEGLRSKWGKLGTEAIVICVTALRRENKLG